MNKFPSLSVLVYRLRDIERSKNNKEVIRLNHLYFDGGVTPEGSVGAFRIFYDDGSEYSVSVKLKGENSTHEAEYLGLIKGLKYIQEKVENVLIIGDCQSIIEQINNKCSCKPIRLRILRSEVWNLLNGIKWKAKWVPRNKNLVG